MNILFFLTPKSEVAFIESTFTLRQILEKMEIHRYSAIPILSGNGEYVGTMEDLIARAMAQNFVPVVDDHNKFIGIVTRKDIIGYCYKKLSQTS